MRKQKLSKQRQLFCKEYLKDLNATQAAIRAGYSEKAARQTGSRLLTNDDIHEQIQKNMNERSEKVEIDAENVLNSILEIRARCMQKEQVFQRIDGEQVPTGEWKFDANNAIKANELLGKHLKLFTDKVEHSGEIKLPNINIIGE